MAPIQLVNVGVGKFHLVAVAALQQLGKKRVALGRRGKRGGVGFRSELGKTQPGHRVDKFAQGYPAVGPVEAEELLVITIHLGLRVRRRGKTPQNLDGLGWHASAVAGNAVAGSAVAGSAEVSVADYARRGTWPLTVRRDRVISGSPGMVSDQAPTPKQAGGLRHAVGR